MEKPNNIVRVSTSVNSQFFKYWLMFLSPLNKLTNKEIEVLALFLKYRYNLSKSIKNNEELLDENVMSEAIRKKIREECNMALPYFQVLLGNLRKKKVIVNNRINPKYIPNIKEENGYFQLLLLFDLG